MPGRTVLISVVIAALTGAALVARALARRRRHPTYPRMRGVRLRDLDEPWYSDLDDPEFDR